MIFLVAILVATLSLSIANPVLSGRQIPPNFQCINPSVTLSPRCLNALNDYIRMANMSNPDLTPAEGFSRLAGLLQSALSVICSSDCLDSYIRCAGNDELVRNLTAQVYCVRAGDGNYCPVKVLQEQARRPGAVLIPPSCITVSSTTCSSSCQQTYRQLRNDLGCCAATFFANPSSPSVSLGRNFANCNVTLSNPCSGAAIIYLNLALVLAMVLVAYAMV